RLRLPLAEAANGAPTWRRRRTLLRRFGNSQATSSKSRARFNQKKSAAGALENRTRLPSTRSASSPSIPPLLSPRSRELPPAPRRTPVMVLVRLRGLPPPVKNATAPAGVIARARLAVLPRRRF